METMSRKKRLLMVGESSYLNTGFAVYGRQLLTKLFNTGKYEIAEIGCYGNSRDPRAQQVQWGFYPNLPDSKEEEELYNNCPMAEHGAWKFESVCLHFKPDVVFSVLDPWMTSYQIYSPLRKYYNLVQMPTVDGIPLMKEWISEYMQLDAALTYTDWGKTQLDKFSGGKIKTIGAAPGGVDTSVFYPVPDKAKHKMELGLPENLLIVGMVGRNQVRKLYPQLLESFAKFISQATPSLAKRTFLYLHTCHPDLGWDIPSLLNEFGIGHKVLFTYYCGNCGLVKPSVYQDVRVYCPGCGDKSLMMPNHNKSIGTDVLAKIYNLFDLYVQYANMEGLGIPVVEALGCGVPAAVVQYSGMEDFVNHVDAIPIPVSSYTRDPMTNRSMAAPDHEEFIHILNTWLSYPNSIRSTRAHQMHEAAKSVFSWDKTTNRWMDCFDNLPFREWTGEPRLHRIPDQAPQMSDEQFVRWCLTSVADRPELVNTYSCLSMMKDLTTGIAIQKPHGMYLNEMSMFSRRRSYMDWNRESLFKEMAAMGQNKNYWERERVKSTAGNSNNNLSTVS